MNVVITVLDIWWPEVALKKICHIISLFPYFSYCWGLGIAMPQDEKEVPSPTLDELLERMDEADWGRTPRAAKRATKSLLFS